MRFSVIELMMRLRDEVILLTKTLERLERLLNQLPPDLQKEVEDFVRFLLARRKKKRREKMRQDWAGALRDYRDEFTSLELQRKALEWRGD
jgi:hypothetical protein